MARVVSRGIRRLRLIAWLDLELQHLLLARRIVAGKPDIDQLAHRSAGRNALKTAFAQDRRLQRELRRQPHADLFAGRRLPGLVVEDRKRSVMAVFDPVGNCRQDKPALMVEQDRDFAPDLCVNGADIFAARDFPIPKPCGDALEARPPQRPRLGPLHQRLEIFLADAAQGERDIVGKCCGKSLGKFAERAVDRRTAVGGR